MVCSMCIIVPIYAYSVAECGVRPGHSRLFTSFYQIFELWQSPLQHLFDFLQEARIKLPSSSTFDSTDSTNWCDQFSQFSTNLANERFQDFPNFSLGFLMVLKGFTEDMPSQIWFRTKMCDRDIRIFGLGGELCSLRLAPDATLQAQLPSWTCPAVRWKATHKHCSEL